MSVLHLAFVADSIGHLRLSWPSVRLAARLSNFCPPALKGQKRLCCGTRPHGRSASNGLTQSSHSVRCGGVFQTGGRKLFFVRFAEKPISAPLSAATPCSHREVAM